MRSEPLDGKLLPKVQLESLKMQHRAMVAGWPLGRQEQFPGLAMSLGLASFGHRLWRGGVGLGPEPQARREVAGGSRLLCLVLARSLALWPASCPRPPCSQLGVGVFLQ